MHPLRNFCHKALLSRATLIAQLRCSTRVLSLTLHVCVIESTAPGPANVFRAGCIFGQITNQYNKQKCQQFLV